MLCAHVEKNPTEIRFCIALRKLEGSIGNDLCFIRDALKASALTNGVTVPDCDGSWHQITLRACNSKFI